VLVKVNVHCDEPVVQARLDVVAQQLVSLGVDLGQLDDTINAHTAYLTQLDVQQREEVCTQSIVINLTFSTQHDTIQLTNCSIFIHLTNKIHKHKHKHY
jgi:hypothetical protein